MDWIDLIKLAGYVALGGGMALSFAGDQRDAATLRSISAMCGGIAGVVDLVEPPKHHGQRAVYNPQLGGFQG